MTRNKNNSSRTFRITFVASHSHRFNPDGAHNFRIIYRFHLKKYSSKAKTTEKAI